MIDFKLRPYQEKFAKQGLEILREHKILILNLEVRCGKTFIAHQIGSAYKKVLFITKKKAIQSIKDDYELGGYSFDLTVVNYESLHKTKGTFGLVICDESNEKISAYPKPTLNAKRVKEFVSNDLILLTGTLLPESNSQIYHQLWVSKYSPFKAFKNFYAFHKALGVKKTLYTSYGEKPCYKEVPYNLIEPYVNNIKISFTQKESGFTANIKEVIHTVKMKPETIDLINRLKKDLVIEGENEVILADTQVKLMAKLHQLSSGTIKFESGNSMIIDSSKIDYIKDKFKGKKIAFYYKFKEEYNLISSAFDLAKDIDEFDNSDKCIALQFVSGRSGIKLDKADCIVAINIDFSNTTYFQFRARMITSTSLQSDIHWIFSDAGFEHQVLKAVRNKENFVLQTFKKL
jgi:hypothetical protein